MSVNPPPNPNISTFNNDYWVTSNVTLTQADADLRYLKYPIAQGTETFSSLTTNTPILGDNIKTVPNISWVQTAINALLGLNNSWTGTNSFSNTTSGSLTSSAIQPLEIDNTTKIPTTAWVQSSIRNFKNITMGDTTIINYAAYKTIFLIGNASGGSYLLQSTSNGTELTFRRVNNAVPNIYTINCDTGITIISNPNGTTVTTFLMTPTIYSVTFIFYNNVWFVTSQLGA